MNDITPNDLMALEDQNPTINKSKLNDGLESPDNKKPTPQTDPWRWMETWLLAYDREHGGEKGREIMEWIWQEPCGG